MDGRFLLVVGVALIGAVYFIGQGELTIGASGGPQAAPIGGGRVIDLRHNRIRQQLVREGYDIDDPASFVRERDGQLNVGGPVAATEHLRPVFIKDVMAGYHRPAMSEQPNTPKQAHPVENCQFTSPAAGSRLGNVFSNATLHHTQLYALDAVELEASAVRYLDHVRDQEEQTASGGGLMQSSRSTELSDPYRYTVMEVMITETAAPVHLVLQGGTGRILWNLHFAKGVELSGISLLGGDIPAVGNLPKGVRVEAMDNAGMAACGIERVVLPRETDPIFQAVDSGALPEGKARAGLEEIHDRVEVWNRWFSDQFGLRSDDTRIGYDKSSIMAVVGPLPATVEDLVPYHTLRHARVEVAPAGQVFVREPEAAENKIRKLIKERATELAEGKLANSGSTTN